MSPSIYNATDGPLTIDRAGRQLGARERTDVDDVTASPLSGHIEADRIVDLDAEAAQAAAAEDVDTADEPTPQRTRKGRASTSTQEA